MRAMALTLSLATLTSAGSAQVLASDDFSYVGNLTANGWVAAVPGSLLPVMADGQVATLQHGVPGLEDVDLPFAAASSTETTYYRFDLEIPSGSSVDPGAVQFFAFLRDISTGVGYGVVSLLFPAGPGDYRLFLEAGGLGTTNATWGADLLFDTQYTVVVNWDAAAGTSRLWVDPVDSSSTSIMSSTLFGGASVGDLRLVQGASVSYVGPMDVDNVIVGKTFDDVLPPTSGGPTTYCTGKTNSLGCVPFITFSGAPSATSTANFSIAGNDVLPNELGFIIYSFKKANLDFHGGKLCVKAPIMRLLPPKTPKATGGPPCTGVVKRNFNNSIQSGNDPLLTPGQTVLTQWRMRDPADPAGFGDGLTDGLRFTIAP